VRDQHPDLDEARRFAEAVHEEFPGKMLAYNCSPSFNWKRKLDAATIAKFQRELARWATASSSSRWPAGT
jgi:isocitrate lyase